MNPLFDEATHTYRHPETGAVIVNVTRALGLLSDWSKVDPVKLEAARQEGLDMHRMVELYMKDDLDEATLPEWLVPRLAAFKVFVAATEFECIASEQRLYNVRYDYAGTTDLIGRVSIPDGRRTTRAVACIDLKRSFYGGKVIGFQTAAYADAWNRSRTKELDLVDRRYALKLHADGQFRLEPFFDSSDLHHFLTCLNFYRLKESLQ